MSIRTAIATIAVCTVMLAAIGGSIGWALGTFSPGYYRSVFYGGSKPEFDPVAVGVGQGLTQGVTGGVVVGLVLVALFVWRDTRIAQHSGAASPLKEIDGRDAPGQVVRRCITGLLTPWIMLGIGIACLMAIPDPELSFGLWYLLLIVCSVTVLGFMVVGIWSLARSARLRHSAWAWGFLAGCFVNLILIGKVGGH